MPVLVPVPEPKKNIEASNEIEHLKEQMESIKTMLNTVVTQMQSVGGSVEENGNEYMRILNEHDISDDVAKKNT